MGSHVAAGETRSAALDFALLGLLALLWGSSYLFIKLAVGEIPPLTLIALRVTIASLFLLAVLFWRGERLPGQPAQWRRLLVQSFLNSIGAWTILAWGQQHVDSGPASVLNSTSPIFVLLITAGFTRHEPVGARRMAGALLGLGGVVLIVGTDALAGLGTQVAGQLAALAGAVLYAFAAIYGRRLAGMSPAVIACGTMLWATAVLVPASLFLDDPLALRPSPTAIGAATALGLLSTGVALMIYFRLLTTLGSLGTASQAYLRAGIGVVLGMALLGETLTPATLAGIGCALGGVVMINLPRGKGRSLRTVNLRAPSRPAVPCLPSIRGRRRRRSTHR
ncbi:MAG: EamA family transporter [Nitratireductor sp.]|nr:EamA family transporter [Nitratireductor sp.]